MPGKLVSLPPFRCSYYRFVSALQALAASAVGLKVALTSTDIMLHRLVATESCYKISAFHINFDEIYSV